METSELLKRVRKIEIKTKELSKHIFSGDYNSTFKGRGMSFSEVRSYQYGDDVRNIDWNVTARYNEPYIKIFEEERELTVLLLIDVSSSTLFGTVGQMKNEMMTELSAVLAFSAINNNDKVGVIFFSDKIEQFIPPKKGKQHILRIIRELITYSYKKDVSQAEAEKNPAAGKSFGERLREAFSALNPSYNSTKEDIKQGTDLASALRYLNNVLKKKGIVFVLSDFMDVGYGDALRIAARRHDIIGVRVFDPMDEKLPPVGLLRAYDPETGEMLWVDCSHEPTRQLHTRGYEEAAAYYRDSFLRSGADALNVRTDGSYINVLRQFFKKRK